MKHPQKARRTPQSPKFLTLPLPNYRKPLSDEFDRRVESLDCIFRSEDFPLEAIGRDRLTGRWFAVRGDDNGVTAQELSLQDTLREMARLHGRASEGYIHSRSSDDAAVSAFFSEVDEAITLLRQNRKAVQS